MKHYHQLSENELIYHLEQQKNCQKTNLGAHAITTGEFTGRAPKDRFIVFDEQTKDAVWWGAINQPFDKSKYNRLKQDIFTVLNSKTLFKRTANIGADPNYRITVKTTVEHASSDLFIKNMFIAKGSDHDSKAIATWHLYCIPSFFAEPKKHGTRKENFVVINFTDRTILIGGTAYTGEIKKSLFTVMNFLMPLHHNVLPMHCSATCSNTKDSTCIFFGLSGTGKTTLSADKKRKLIGDDEHGWTPKNTIFNFEGGCYAKVWKIDKEKEPSIYRAIRRGALLENVVIKENQTVDFDDASITENTRVSYPLGHIDHIQTPAIGYHPKHLFFLSADAFGVLPPLALLSPNQAAYHFISGYTAKIPGTEAGVTKPEPHFSACFGAPFMPLHPKVYASLLERKIKEHNTCVWLVNTGWIGGPYNVGRRIPLHYTRSLIDAVIKNQIDPNDANRFKKHGIFQFQQLTEFDGIPSHVLNPREGWKNDTDYVCQARELAKSFHRNFEQFQAQVASTFAQAGPITDTP